MGLFDSLIKIKEDVDTWIYKGIDFKKFEKYYEALVCFDKALEINPNSTEAWINKGEVLKEIGRHKEAKVCFDKVLEIDPEYVSDFQEKKSMGNTKKSYSSSSGNEFLGFLLIIIGILLVIGNLSGLFPTFPFAGFITMSIGWLFVHG